jgi:hypothetical protein
MMIRRCYSSILPVEQAAGIGSLFHWCYRVPLAIHAAHATPQIMKVIAFFHRSVIEICFILLSQSNYRYFHFSKV